MDYNEKINDENRAFEKLVDHLARRDHSVKELNDKLAEKFTSASVEAALQMADEQNYLADPAELSKRVTQEMHRKNKGFLYIQNYLCEKGLPATDKDPEVEVEKAQDVLASKFNLQDPLHDEDRVKLERRLKNRGFDLDTIKNVIQQLKFQGTEDSE